MHRGVSGVRLTTTPGARPRNSAPGEPSAVRNQGIRRRCPPAGPGHGATREVPVPQLTPDRLPESDPQLLPIPQPSPMADTSKLLFPSLRFCIDSPFSRRVGHSRHYARTMPGVIGSACRVAQAAIGSSRPADLDVRATGGPKPGLVPSQIGANRGCPTSPQTTRGDGTAKALASVERRAGVNAEPVRTNSWSSHP